MSESKIQANLVDYRKRKIYPAEIFMLDGRISEIKKLKHVVSDYILPAFVDSHIHIESSMLSPQNFSVASLKHGTVATVSDPHEICNVLGIDGIDFMIDNASDSPLKFYFGAPSCVPATDFETSGARINSSDIEKLYEKYDLRFLSEVMNFPGVIQGDPEVIEKIRISKNRNKCIDGHAPGLSGIDLDKYISAGIQTDHECFTFDEALEKIEKGMIVQIREGSAARNFDNLYSLIDSHTDKVMLCSDDLHPDDLIKGHINLLLKKGISKGLDLFNLCKVVNENPVKHYNLDVGMLRIGDPADFVIVQDVENFNVISTYINGIAVFQNGILNYSPGNQKTPNKFYVNFPEKDDLKIAYNGKLIRVIKALDGELITKSEIVNPKVERGEVVADPDNDILKIVVQNRYEKEKPAVGFIKGVGILKGAMASSIAHDSHNIIVAGSDDQYILECIDWINKRNGGIAFHNGVSIFGLTLKIAGIISDRDAEYTASVYAKLDNAVKNSGSKLKSPFMTLSFMALQVIPELKIGNKGLFDVSNFKFTSVYV